MHNFKYGNDNPLFAHPIILLNFTDNDNRLLFQVPDPTCTIAPWSACNGTNATTECGGPTCGTCIETILPYYVCKLVIGAGEDKH